MDWQHNQFRQSAITSVYLDQYDEDYHIDDKTEHAQKPTQTQISQPSLNHSKISSTSFKTQDQSNQLPQKQNNLHQFYTWQAQTQEQKKQSNQIDHLFSQSQEQQSDSVQNKNEIEQPQIQPHQVNESQQTVYSHENQQNQQQRISETIHQHPQEDATDVVSVQKSKHPDLVELDFLRQSFLDRKTKGYLNMKQWQDDTLRCAEKHHKIQEEIFLTFESKSLETIKNNETLVDYFKKSIELLRSTSKFLLQPNLKLQESFRYSESKINFPSINQAVNQLLFSQQQKGLQMQKMIQAIESSIMINMYNDMQHQRDSIKNKHNEFVQLKKKIIEQRKNIQRRQDKYQRVYDEMLANNGLHKLRNKDLFHKERKLYNEIQNYLNDIVQVGDFIYTAFQEITSQEKERYDTLMNNLCLLGQLDFFSGISVQQQNSECVSIQEVLNQNQQALIIRQLQIENLDNSSFKYFLSEYIKDQVINLGSLSLNPLVIYHQENIQQDVGKFLQSWNSVIILLTLDFHLVVIFEGKITHKVQIEVLTLKQRAQHPVIANITYKVPRLIFDQNEQVLLKFDYQDDFDKLQEAIQKLKLDYSKLHFQ